MSAQRGEVTDRALESGQLLDVNPHHNLKSCPHEAGTQAERGEFIHPLLSASPEQLVSLELTFFSSNVEKMLERNPTPIYILQETLIYCTNMSSLL